MDGTPTLLGEIFASVQHRMKEDNLASYEEYMELVDGVIIEFVDAGKMTEDEDTPALREGLEKMYWQQESERGEEDSEIKDNHHE